MTTAFPESRQFWYAFYADEEGEPLTVGQVIGWTSAGTLGAVATDRRRPEG